jgi:hypothetical protein
MLPIQATQPLEAALQEYAETVMGVAVRELATPVVKILPV